MKINNNFLSLLTIVICILVAIVVVYFFYVGYHENQNWEHIHNNGDKMKVQPRKTDSYVTQCNFFNKHKHYME